MMWRWLMLPLLFVSLVACDAKLESGPHVDTGLAGELQVVAQEFSFALNRTTLPAGATTIAISNRGHAPHDFQLIGPGVEVQTAMLDAGGVTQLSVDLQPGTYTYLCTIGGHEQMGMRGTLLVEG
jgi:plastocyanin